MEKKHVIVAYLKHKNKFLLLKRSAFVESFKNQWSTITGKIEPHDKDPLQSAVREIQEEAGFMPMQVTLVRRGEPFEARMKDKVRIIYPFLFEAQHDQVQLNWENSEYAWVHAGQINDFETVEGVGSTLRKLINE
ncbi:MAG TPA: NUDIX domain-containing protein [Candidatus Nanoarchaeia archaeon]|nr:NUDIX domain-containing protein [Candidatus Nanoarchaeia archaeon]